MDKLMLGCKATNHSGRNTKSAEGIKASPGPLELSAPGT